MAYFVGRDVDIAITTEHPTQGIMVREPDSASGALQDKHIAIAVDFAQASVSDDIQMYDNASDYPYLFAGPRALSTAGGCDGNAAFEELNGDGTLLLNGHDWNNQPNNLTGLELSLGVMDEDVAFIGQRNIMKAEIKKDNSVSLTRKKSDKVWDGIYNDARFGIKENNDVAVPTAAIPLPGLFTGLSAPDFVTCGYRVVLRFAAKAAVDSGANVNDSGTFAAGDTSLTAQANTLDNGDYIRIEEEILKVTSGGGTTTLTVVRGQLGTEDAAHPDASDIYDLGPGGEGEVIVLRNCYVTDHGVTLSADGSQEETLSLQSYTDPKIYDGIECGLWDVATTSTEL